ncbi:MAG: carboxymuconolactone decarboxylase family protein [Acidobacteriota bacterium]|nr:carboxymuconolactone decarboxylase family protein [Acidobacteriota bacterium]
MSHRLQGFRTFREKMNQRILDQNNVQINRFFALDTRAYEGGALDTRTKELAGLAASLVLRCDDCIAYHVLRCKELGIGDDELFEIFNVGLVVGGSIVIPHLRRAVELIDEVNDELGATPS